MRTGIGSCRVLICACLEAGTKPFAPAAVCGAVVLHFGVGVAALLESGTEALSRDVVYDGCLPDDPVAGDLSAPRFRNLPNGTCCTVPVGIGNRIYVAYRLPRLQLTNLQNVPLQISDFTAAAKEQLTLYPEYILPALWPQKEKKPRHPLLRLASLAIGFDVGVHFLLELFYGAAMPTRIDPVHAVARCGALSVFNRLESLQLILWVMAITLKLALYLYAICLLLDREGTRGTSVRLEHFPLYFAGIWMLCALLRRIDVQEAMQMRSVLTWGFALLVGMGGVAAWMCRKIRRCS